MKEIPAYSHDHVRFAEMTFDSRLQLRGGCDETKILEYVSVFEEYKGVFDGTPPTVVWDGNTFLVCDGFHRCQAGMRAKTETGEPFTSIMCRVYQGDFALARLLAAAANKGHGIPRDPATVMAAIGVIHEDSDWYPKPAREIARFIGCSHGTVNNWRKANNYQKPESVPVTRIGKDGEKTEYQYTLPTKQKKEEDRPTVLPLSDNGHTPAEDAKVQLDARPIESAPPAASKPAASGPPKTDAYGQSIPYGLQAVFAESKEVFDVARRLLRELDQWHKSNIGKPCMARMDKGRLDSDRKNLRACLLHSEPVAVCPTCRGTKMDRGAKCGCKVGFVTRSNAKHLGLKLNPNDTGD